ncbi:hypothetical protein BJ912DRAFT_2800 [Pholiota molesta]|nr:hypothetical protein BJ912DRAFT_2800 [Pholiota molesta]
MFSLPQENANNQTNSDEHPLVLYDDVDDFRALCWIMYALPTEYSRQHSINTADIQKLVSIFLISHKYHFEAHETFARDLLSKHCRTLIAKPNSKHNYFNRCPESRLEAILRIVILTSQTRNFPLHPSTIQNIWTNRLEQTKGSISCALGVADALGLRKFVGELYYIELTRMKPVPLQGSPAYVHPVVSALESHQKLALYQGNWSLRYYWSKTLKMAQSQPELSKRLECVDPNGVSGHFCPAIWKAAWKEIDGNQWDSSPFDPLKEILKVYTQIVGRNDVRAPCAVNSIQSIVDDLKDNIADHFLGPPSPISISDVAL